MERTRECVTRGREGASSSVSRCHSQEFLLDSSSASSLSVFADHSDTQRNNSDSPKTETASPRTSMDEVLKSEASFLQYLSSIPALSEYHRTAESTSGARTRSPAGQGASGPTASKVGLDHLDNLCKLMEQLGELRDTNSKLQKRVQYLEDLKSLHDMHREICEGVEGDRDDPLPPKSGGPYPLTKSATESLCIKKGGSAGQSRSPSRYLSRRSRNPSDGQRRCRSKSVGHEDTAEDPKSRRIFPKWSRVKEAFGWESERKESLKLKADLTSRRRSDESSCRTRTYRQSARPTWYMEYPSIHSSVEDVREEYGDNWKKDTESSEKSGEQLDLPQDVLRRQKSTPSPSSGKLSPDGTDLKPKSFTLERDSCGAHDFSKFDKEEAGKRGKSPWGRVKHIIERHRGSLKRKSARQSATDLDLVDITDQKTTCTEGAELSGQRGRKPGPIVIEQQEEEKGATRTPSSSPTLQRSKSKWGRMGRVLKHRKEGDKDSLSTPTSPNSQPDGNFTFDVEQESLAMPCPTDRGMSRISSDSHVHQLALSAAATPSSELMLQLQRNLSEDFHRKIQEWDRIRGASSSGNGVRKKAGAGAAAELKPKMIKELPWLEKELQKVEKEKRRLEKERKKYEERASRLEKLRETVLAGEDKREVLVRTSAGEFRFEGISDAFTKKLYEWETKRGLGPELSTLALLNMSRPPSQVGPMQRTLSRSESSIADIGHTSSNSLPSSKGAEGPETDRLSHPSKADSEPDLSTLTTFGNNLSPPASKRAPLVGREMRLKSEEENADGRRESESEETYYGLLEENVVLLERLREKEEICRRLERDLEILDEKMDEMNAHHGQETQRYREKLWELHRQGASPSDVLCCRRTMEQLQKRIEILERWTKKLRNDRETVEVHYRHHSKEQESMTLDLLSRMRELQVTGSSGPEPESQQLQKMDNSTIERVQALSALLTKQTQDLQETLSEKTRQICQLKWELLYRDLSTVKRETEGHSHVNPAQRRRDKYANWRSRSSEEPSAAAGQHTKVDSPVCQMGSADVYCVPSPLDEFKATHLANTVQQLHKELLKLTSDTNIPTLQKSGFSETALTSIVSSTKNIEAPRIHKKLSNKANTKKITVRRNSADNLSLASVEDNRSKCHNFSSTQSDESSDEYYDRVCYNGGTKLNLTDNSKSERLLMSYGEYPPRVHMQRKKKLHRMSKLNSNLLRKRSNTFHTNRDLQKPNIIDQTPQKCQSFRVPRENFREDSPIAKTLYLRHKLQNSNIPVVQDANFITAKTQTDTSPSDNVSSRELLENYNIRLSREVASDSKIPAILQARQLAEKTCSNTHAPIRSMSDKTKEELAFQKRENVLKTKTKKRLKASNSLSTKDVKLSFLEQLSLQNRDYTHAHKKENTKDIKKSQTEATESKKKNPSSEIPTITIQLPKRKHRKFSRIVTDDDIAEEHSFTLSIPRKRSQSTECDSSISESSPREDTKFSHSDRTNNSSDSLFDRSPTVRSKTDSCLSKSNNSPPVTENGNIKLMRLVSLNTFDSPFTDTSDNAPVSDQKVGSTVMTSEGATDSMVSSMRFEQVGMVLSNEKECRETNWRVEDRSTTTTEQTDGNYCSVTYMKSPSAPQLDWRKACAKKMSKSGAPNVRTLIDRYNQKIVESQTPKSPLSSNMSSPATPRKISTPSSPSFRPEYYPGFCSTPTTPTSSPSYTPLAFRSNISGMTTSPPSSPSIARSEALQRAKQNFITRKISAPNSPAMLRSIPPPSASPKKESKPLNRKQSRFEGSCTAGTKPVEDRMSNSSMDSMSLVVLRAGESSRESRLPKRVQDRTREEESNPNPLKTSKSLSNSSLFRTVLSPDFKMPTNLLKLRRSKKKKDMGAVTELCRRSLLLTGEDTCLPSSPISHKSCPSSPELKTKSVAKSSWLQRNIFRHK